MHSAQIRPRQDGARKVRTLLPVRDEVRLSKSYQDATVSWIRILKELRLPNRELVHRGNLLYWRLSTRFPPGLDQEDPELTGDEGCAGQHKKGDELSP